MLPQAEAWHPDRLGGIFSVMRRAFAGKLSDTQRRLHHAGRKLALLVLVAIVAGAIPLADHFGVFGRARTPDYPKYHGKVFRVVHVVDGDTLDVDAYDDVRHKPSTRIRLWGVDTPETVDPRKSKPDHFGPEASAFTKALAKDANVLLELDPTRTRDNDKYNRLLAYVVLPDGNMLNRVLVEEGYGYADPRYDHKYKREFERLMKQAKSAGRGLWKDVRPEDLPYYLKKDEKLPAR